MFAGWLEDAMKKAGASEREVASAVGISQQAVSRWRVGVSHPSGRNIGRLATILRVSSDEIIRQLEASQGLDRTLSETSRSELLTEVRDLRRRLEQVEETLRLAVRESERTAGQG
jgi:transcriptional regulator with XRE-family HTH domain